MKPSVKNFALIFAALVFGSSVLGTSVVRTTAQTTSNFKLSSTTINSAPQEKSALSPEATASAGANYYLPYPGILPDNPLYFLKMFRDKVWLFLTFDSLKKSQTLLLFADKRLGAGETLIKGGKVDLGISTITKGEKYLEQAIVEAQKANKAGKDTKALSQQLLQAALKHQEVLNELLGQVSDSTKPALNAALRYSTEGYKILISPQN